MPARNNQIECSEGCRPCNPDCQVLKACPEFLRQDDEELYRSENWQAWDPCLEGVREIDRLKAARMMR